MCIYTDVYGVHVMMARDAAAAERAGRQRRQQPVVVAAQRDGMQPRVVALQLQLQRVPHSQSLTESMPISIPA
jgi:hypothetical protein